MSNSHSQELANGLSYIERYNNYKAWFSSREKMRPNLKPWKYTQKIKPWSYQQWLKLSTTSSLPAHCRAGQGKEEWQK